MRSTAIGARRFLSCLESRKPIHMTKSILVVDDDSEIVAMLNTRLSKRGYKVSTAGDGNRAIELAKREKPDIVLLDVMMPGKSGWEVARALKQDPVTQDVKFVMVSAIGEKP